MHLYVGIENLSLQHRDSEKFKKYYGILNILKPKSFKDLGLLTIKFFQNVPLNKNEFNHRVKYIETCYEDVCKNIKPKDNYTRFYNKFYGEIKPAQVLINNINSSKITLCTEGSKFDATLEIHGIKKSIEFVRAHDGELHDHQMEYLEKNGEFNMRDILYTNQKPKSSKEREIHRRPPTEAEEEKFDKKISDFLRKSIKIKTRKNNKEYQGAWLVVSFDKFHFLKMDNINIEYILNELNIPENQFEKIFIIGLNGFNNDFFKML